jgi:S-adenosylmethionine hydrolase
MKGVILGISPGVRLIDLTHEVPPQAIRLGALVLRSAVEYFPAGTIHLAVVDPGVGSARQAILVVTPRAVLVGPDNGLLAPAARALGASAIHRLEREDLFRHPVSCTFHGRDVFAPVAAHLAAGTSPESVGPPVATLQPLDLPEPHAEIGAVHGEIIYVDHFGNLVTNISAAAIAGFPASGVSVTIAGMRISPLAPTYAAVSSGAAVCVIGSWGMLEVAVRDGNAAERFGAGIATPISVVAE